VIRRIGLACVTAVLTFSPATSAERAHVRGPWLLVSLAALGTVTWRCDPARHPGLALGFRASPTGQDGSLRLRARGRTVSTHTFRPRQTIELPYLRAATQRLDITEGGENGSLRASVTVGFDANSGGYCFSYMPPKVDVHFGPRVPWR
jgi:hypothetical protein